MTTWMISCPIDQISGEYLHPYWDGPFSGGQLLNFRVGLYSFLEECRVIRRFHDWNYPTNSEVIITMAMNHL